MPASNSFLRDLEESVCRGAPRSCPNALWHAVDALVAGRFTEDEISIFDDVVGRLAEDIEQAARARLADQLAPSENAPPKIIRRLASDDAVEVAGPVLKRSCRLDARDLVASASVKGQRHLLAISERRDLPAEVTDILVVRGSPAVARSVVANEGAKISGSGFMHLIRRAAGDRSLAESVGMRRDVPRGVFRDLLAKASDDVRRKLERERPEMREVVDEVVTAVAGGYVSARGPIEDPFVRRRLERLHREGGLDEDVVFDFAYTIRPAEVSAGLALLCDLPVETSARAVADADREPVMIMMKALGFRWETAMAVLFLGAPDHRIRESELARLRSAFEDLDVESSKAVLALYRAARPKAPAAPAF